MLRGGEDGQHLIVTTRVYLFLEQRLDGRGEGRAYGKRHGEFEGALWVGLNQIGQRRKTDPSNSETFGFQPGVGLSARGLPVTLGPFLERGKFRLGDRLLPQPLLAAGKIHPRRDSYRAPAGVA